MSAIKVGIVSIVVGALGCVAIVVTPSWFPVAAAVQATRQDDLYLALMFMSSFIMAIVTVFMLYSVWKWRARPGDENRDGPPIHGNTNLEIAWTLIPTILVTAIGIVSAVVLAQNSHAGSNPLRIHVLAQQFAWEFTYPNGKKSGYLELPVNHKVELELEARDVIHSFWVPELSQKQDAVPGITTHIVITPIIKGTFPVICTELCGLGHSLMRSHVNIVSLTAYTQWVKSTQPVGGPVGLSLFQTNCASCHTLSAANATGTIGPDLDKLVSYAKQAHQPLESFVRESIVNPNAYIQPGYPKDVMPQNFGQLLTKEQLDSLVTFLVQSAQQSGTK